VTSVLFGTCLVSGKVLHAGWGRCQAHRVYLLELMQQWTRLKEGEARDDLSLALVVDAELFRLDAVIRWLDAAEVRLARAAAEPPRPASAPVPGPQLRRLGARR
jgi:hypothetical protein